MCCAKPPVADPGNPLLGDHRTLVDRPVARSASPRNLAQEDGCAKRSWMGRPSKRRRRKRLKSRLILFLLRPVASLAARSASKGRALDRGTLRPCVRQAGSMASCLGAFPRRCGWRPHPRAAKRPSSAPGPRRSSWRWRRRSCSQPPTRSRAVASAPAPLPSRWTNRMSAVLGRLEPRSNPLLQQTAAKPALAFRIGLAAVDDQSLDVGDQRGVRRTFAEQKESHEDGSSFHSSS